jgi:hypothetical protein
MVERTMLFQPGRCKVGTSLANRCASRRYNPSLFWQAANRSQFSFLSAIKRVVAGTTEEACALKTGRD